MKQIYLIIIFISFLPHLSHAQCEGNITGTLINELGDPVVNAQVMLVIDDDSSSSSITDAQGNFSLRVTNVDQTMAGIEINSNNHLNGVSTLDMVLMIRHILGVNDIVDDLGLLKADVNCDGQVSMIDVVYMRRVILGIDPHFPSGDYCASSNQGVNISQLNIQNCNLELTNSLEIIAIAKGNVNGN